MSITLRLTALFTAAILSILTLAAALLYWRLSDALEDEDARLLLENVAALRAGYLGSPDRSDFLETEIVTEPRASRTEPYSYRLVREGGTVVETPGMHSSLPVELFLESVAPDAERPVRWRSPAGHSYLLFSSAIGATDGERFQAALDVTHDQTLLRGYRRTLVMVVLVGSLLAALAGQAMARRGLAPIGRLTRSMHRITAHSLDARIATGEWPRELRDLASVFDQMLGRLEDSFGRLSRFSADLAHELRTPLANMRGEAEVALTRARSEAEYRHVLESGLEELERLGGLVDKLLFMARADAGTAIVEPRELDGATEIEEAWAFYEAVAEQRGITVELGGHGDVVADPLLFRRALANLLSNALEHTPPGGRVSVHVATAPEGVTVSVQDTGAGIAPEHLPHITDRFYRASDARDRRDGGAGLGLAFTRSIMDLHDGRITVASTPGRGTRVSLFFPRQPSVSSTRSGA